MNFKHAAGYAVLVAASCLAGAAAAADAIRIGEINSYKAQAAFLEPYKKGMELALEQVNAG
ncbi:MAG TPA: ABC transporter substrate-binding protein, partial [Noviherbaspirillum sp.]